MPSQTGKQEAYLPLDYLYFLLYFCYKHNTTTGQGQDHYSEEGIISSYQIRYFL